MFEAAFQFECSALSFVFGMVLAIPLLFLTSGKPTLSARLIAWGIEVLVFAAAAAAYTIFGYVFNFPNLRLYMPLSVFSGVIALFLIRRRIKGRRS